MGQAETLQVGGRERLRMYQPANERFESYFCEYCGNHLYVFLPDWSQWIYPFASAPDIPLPSSLEIFHALLGETVDWVEVSEGDEHHHPAQNTKEPNWKVASAVTTN
jgi:hypothetical protein